MLIIEWRPVTQAEYIPPLGEELMRHLENRKGAVKHTSCSAWNLLFQTMQENGLPVSTVSFTDTMKPYFLNSRIHFSISHSHDVCAVAVADKPVGVDVEIIKTSYPPHLIERSLTATEQDSFDGDFTRLWCRKEAVAKMTGQGITGYPRNLDTKKYEFKEQMIEWNGQKYWLVATTSPSVIEQEHHK